MKAMEEFADLVQTHGANIPLDRGLLALSALESPGLSTEDSLREIDRLAKQTKTSEGVIEGLRVTLYDRLGFQGNQKNYYDPKNSLLNEVLKRRLGIPITLAVVYIEVARRLGSEAVGVGFPGHFLIRHEGKFLDPFDRARTLREADCERMLKRIGQPGKLESSMFAPATRRSIIVRVLHNLKNAYLKRGDWMAATLAIDRMLIVEPKLLKERRDRGLLYARLGLEESARADLEHYLSTEPPAKERASIEKTISKLKPSEQRSN